MPHQFRTMRIAEVHRWLQGSKPYPIGVELFKKHVQSPINPIANVLLNGPEHSLSRRVLEEELRAIGDSGVQAVQRVSAQTQAPPPASAPQPTNPTQDRLIASEEQAIKEMYGEVDRLRGQMVELTYEPPGNFFRKNPDANRLRAMARRVMLVDHNIKRAYERIAHIREFGNTPDEALQEMMPKVCEWLSQAGTWENYIKKEHSHMRKTGRFRNKETFDTRLQQLRELTNFIKKHSDEDTTRLEQFIERYGAESGTKA